MPVFEYTALNATGQRVGGVLSGASEQAVMTELESRQLVPVSIEAKEESRPLWRRRGISSRRLAGSYLQIGDLLKAGVPLLRGLKLLGNRRSDPRLSAVFRDLSESVSQGSDLGEAMSKHPEVFPRVHIAMVRAGEKGGFLEQVMSRLGRFVLAQADLKGKLIGNLIYPAVLVGAGTIVLAVIFGFFVPKFKPIYAAMPNLPGITKFVFGVSSLVGRYGPWTLGVLVIGGIVLWRMAQRQLVRRKIAEALTKAPVYGPLVRSMAAARFCRMLGTMLGNGIPMLAAMQIARDAAGNVLMEDAIGRASEAVRAGQPLAGPLAESRLFGDDVIEMISVAESANNLDEVLSTIAGTIDDRVDRMLTTAIRLLEPLLIVAIAIVVAVVAAGLILPMTKMNAGF
jgi:general secretion pathway protein F/type IV pilus assembly protein PilC